MKWTEEPGWLDSGVIVWLRNPYVQIRLSTWLLVIALINWPLSHFTYASNEPPLVLSLSWAAIVLTCVSIIVTTDVGETVKD